MQGNEVFKILMEECQNINLDNFILELVMNAFWNLYFKKPTHPEILPKKIDPFI